MTNFFLNLQEVFSALISSHNLIFFYLLISLHVINLDDMYIIVADKMSCKKLRLSNELEFDNHESNSNENWLQENAGPSQPDSFQGMCYMIFKRLCTAIFMISITGIKRKQNAIKIAPKTAAWKKTFIDVYIKGENREQYSMNEPQSELDIFSSCSYDVFEPILQNLDFIDLLNLYHTNTFYGKMARTYYFHKYRKLTVSLTSNFTTNERFFYVCDGEFVIQDFKTTMEVLRCFGDMIESMEVINSNSFISMSHFEKFLRMAEYVSQYCGNLINFKYSGVLEKSIRNLFLTNIYEKKLTIEVFCEFEHYGQIDRAKKHEHCFKISKYSSNFELVIIGECNKEIDLVIILSVAYSINGHSKY